MIYFANILLANNRKCRMKLPIHQYYPEASQLILGAMHLGAPWDSSPVSKDNITEAMDLLSTALDNNINILDLADIYTFGKAETTIGEVFKRERSLRPHLILQSKVGIKLPTEDTVKQYDLSAAWLTESVNASVKRLHDNQLDVLFLHRPDPLFRLDESMEALSKLHQQGKFEYLAVSNMHAGQIAYLQSGTQIPIIANQLEMSLQSYDFVEDGITTNTKLNATNGFPRGTIEYCQQTNMQLQAWGSMAQGRFSSLNDNASPEQKNTFEETSRLAQQYDTNNAAIVLAWLMKHPANIQPVIGTTKSERLIDAAQSVGIKLSRNDWFSLYQAIRGSEIP